jgi:hypothetical protein
MFLTLCSPRSSSGYGSLSRICSRTVPETQTPPGSASASSRAATLTPSPKMSSPSTITSPRLMPMRSLICCASIASGSRSIIPRCTSAAQRIDDAGEFCQQAVAGGLDDAAMMLGDLRVDQLPSQRLETFERAFLVRPH